MANPCSQCRFFVPPVGSAPRGECHALPPNFAVEKPTANDTFVFVGHWPRVLPTDFCGHFRPVDPPEPARDVEVDSIDTTFETLQVVTSQAPEVAETETEPEQAGEPETEPEPVTESEQAEPSPAAEGKEAKPRARKPRG